MPKRGHSTSLSEEPVMGGVPEWWDPVGVPTGASLMLNRQRASTSLQQRLSADVPRRAPDHREPWRHKGPRGAASARSQALDRQASCAKSPIARQAAQPLLPRASPSSSPSSKGRRVHGKKEQRNEDDGGHADGHARRPGRHGAEMEPTPISAPTRGAEGHSGGGVPQKKKKKKKKKAKGEACGHDAG